MAKPTDWTEEQQEFLAEWDRYLELNRQPPELDAGLTAYLDQLESEGRSGLAFLDDEAA